ncbi:MAG: S-methyl-5-thioribose-1-phosphate isomerase [Methanomassiliicoccales archaeon]
MRLVIDGKAREIRALWWEKDALMMIDQRIIPREIKTVRLSSFEQVRDSIKDMTVRGAPAIGAAAAYGMIFAKRQKMDMTHAATVMKQARPTAFDLFFAVDWMVAADGEGKDLVQAANDYADMIVEKCRLIGEYGEPLIRPGARIMTHCNAGALATVDHGTALAPMRAAWKKGKPFFVYVSETRPRLQGMKLTAFELLHEGIPHAIIPDGASGHFLRLGVDLVIVGTDRIAANGDFANKIGTYEKAVLAKELGVPFYVAAPVSTFDPSLASGEDIPIEVRGVEEITHIDGIRIAPEGCGALNPSFDMTPARYVTGFITEEGILKPSEIAKIKGRRK